MADPFSHLAGLSPTAELEKSPRAACPLCGANRSVFCFDCLLPLVDGLPMVALPCAVHIVKHQAERNSKSTATHAPLLSGAALLEWRSTAEAAAARAGPPWEARRRAAEEARGRAEQKKEATKRKQAKKRTEEHARQLKTREQRRAFEEADDAAHGQLLLPGVAVHRQGQDGREVASHLRWHSSSRVRILRMMIFC